MDGFLWSTNGLTRGFVHIFFGTAGGLPDSVTRRGGDFKVTVVDDDFVVLPGLSKNLSVGEEVSTPFMFCRKLELEDTYAHPGGLEKAVSKDTVSRRSGADEVNDDVFLLLEED